MIITNKWGLPKSLERAIKNDGYTGPGKDSSMVSVTTLIGPPKIHYLKKKYWDKISEDIVDNIWRFFGTASHEAVRKGEGNNSLAEQRIEKEINGVKVSGAFDLYEADEQIILDYKFTSAFTAVYNPNGKPEHIKQLNIYKYLLEGCGFPVKELKIVMILRDWSESKYVPGGNYPEIPVKVIDIPIMSKDEIEQYLKDRTELFKSCANLEDDKLPDCTDEEMWKSPTKYAVMKKNRKTAVKIYDTEKDAKAATPDDGDHYVEVRKGENKRCQKYCPVNKWCNVYNYDKKL